MPIDLDTAIYPIPCGVPGDVNALSGRAHICSDRMRIAVTLCEPWPVVDCYFCPDDSPQVLEMTISGVQTCSCVAEEHYRELECGGLAGRWQLGGWPRQDWDQWEWIEGYPFYSHRNCTWSTRRPIARGVYRFWDSDCAEVLVEQEHEIYPVVCRTMYWPNRNGWLVGLAAHKLPSGGAMHVFRGEYEVGEPGCPLPITVSNVLTCGAWEALGTSGQATVEFVK